MDLIRAKSITVTRTCLAPAMEQVDDQWGKGSYGDCSQYIKYLITRTDELGVRNHRLAILIFSGALVSLALLVLTLYIFVSFRYVKNYEYVQGVLCLRGFLRLWKNNHVGSKPCKLREE